jgi:trk system potassium uptake protein TrkA
LSEELPDTLIIHGDGTDLELLKSEGIATIDAFIALSGFDEENILATLLARQNGAKKGIAKVNRENYISLASNIGVDTTITPSLITTSKILGFIRRETVLSLSLLPGGEAEVIEFIIGPDSNAVDIPLKELNLPEDTIITTIIRDNKVIIPHGQDVIKKYDRVIVITKAETAGQVREFLLGKERIRKNGFWTGFKNNRPPLNH